MEFPLHNMRMHRQPTPALSEPLSTQMVSDGTPVEHQDPQRCLIHEHLPHTPLNIPTALGRKRKTQGGNKGFKNGAVALRPVFIWTRTLSGLQRLSRHGFNSCGTCI